MPRSSKGRNVRHWIRLAGLVCLLGLASCSGRKPLFSVQGKVLDKNNKPAAGAKVIFNPDPADTQETLKPVGECDANGEFKLTTYTKDDGAPAGDYVITIIWLPPVSQLKSPFDPAKGHDQLEGRYASPERSKHRFKVEQQPDNVVPTIVLQ
jgi:hypothetical protein